MLGSRILKYSLLWILIPFFSLNTYAQNDSIFIELILSVIDQDNGESKKGFELQLIKNDTIVINYKTDSAGFVYAVLEPNSDYRVKINDNYDHFTTKGLKHSTRIIREVIIMKGCQGIPPKIKINYELNSVIPKDVINIIDYYSTFLNKNPKLVMEIRCFRTNKEHKKVSYKRSKYIFDELVKKGVEGDRLVVVDGGVKEFLNENKNYVAEGEVLIISLEYTPIKK